MDDGSGKLFRESNVELLQPGWVSVRVFLGKKTADLEQVGCLVIGWGCLGFHFLG